MIHVSAPLGESAYAQEIGLCGNRHIVTLNDSRWPCAAFSHE